MTPIRQIIEEAPAFIPIPADLQHRRIELIIWPLAEDKDSQPDKVSTASGEHQGVSFYELGQSFAGCVDSQLGDLSTNPRYMDGFGE